MNEQKRVAESSYDRRAVFTPPPRPDWMRTLNALGAGLDIKGMVPLTPNSLIQQAIANTGLEDFGDEEWREAFEILVNAIDKEADLHLAGRLLTRAEFLHYLEGRLGIVDCYRRNPEIEQEVIDRPVYITGYGRSGTTILFELLSQDPQFRVAQKWEALFPVPPPQAATYGIGARIAKTDGVNNLIEAMIPEFGGVHKIGADLPVEGIELEYMTFLSEIFPMFMHVPSYAAYLRKKDLVSSFAWQRKMLKLLQSRYKRRHWLIKSPSHFPHLEKYLGVFPGMRVIFTHRDPVVTADSVASFFGALYWMRSDNLWGDGEIEVEVLQTAERRARAWDPVIAMIEDGRIASGSYANFYYHRFIADPIGAVRSVYDQLDMTLTDAVADKMRAYLADRPKDKYGKHQYEPAPASAVESERGLYRDYQNYFSIPNEI